MPSPLHLALALDGAGWHPAACRLEAARPTELLKAGYWADVVGEAEKGLVDFVTIEDSLGLQSSDLGGSDKRTDRVRGRLDAVLVATSVAPRTTNIGLVPSVVATHTEPFHISKAAQLADLVLEWRQAGLSGSRLRPGTVPQDLEAVTRALVPELQARGVSRRSYQAATLRGLLGMPRPVNRHVAA
ncbi:MAG TPA: hypothetical protein VEJ84_04310 [Acidimicrobiales bacterium]|nr:hypothetical protein [Acidimicrobiales bacterium]